MTESTTTLSTCPRCGDFADPADLDPSAGVCSTCLAAGHVHPGRPRWEAPGEGGDARAFVQTVRGILTAPRAFFSDLEVRPTVGGALGFFVVVTLISNVGMFAVDLLLPWSELRLEHAGDPEGLVKSAGGSVVSGVLPAVLGLYVGSAIFCGALALVRQPRPSIKQMIRINSYSAAPNLFAWHWTIALPIIAWSLGLWMYGVHRGAGTPLRWVIGVWLLIMIGLGALVFGVLLAMGI